MGHLKHLTMRPVQYKCRKMHRVTLESGYGRRHHRQMQDWFLFQSARSERHLHLCKGSQKLTQFHFKALLRKKTWFNHSRGNFFLLTSFGSFLKMKPSFLAACCITESRVTLIALWWRVWVSSSCPEPALFSPLLALWISLSTEQAVQQCCGQRNPRDSKRAVANLRTQASW